MCGKQIGTVKFDNDIVVTQAEGHVRRARPCVWGRTARVCLHGWTFLSCESRTDAGDDVRIQSGPAMLALRFGNPLLVK
jgi:hypothetical protein